MLFLSLPAFTFAIAFSAEHPSKASKEWNGKVSGMGGERYRQEARRPGRIRWLLSTSASIWIAG
jgi:hypothetical protein